jgi:hypothetical protein
MTNTPTTVTGVTVTAPATGLYLVLGAATVSVADPNPVATPVFLTLKARNTTAGADIGPTVQGIVITPATVYSDLTYITQFKTATLTTGDVVALQISMASIPAGSTIVTTSGSLAIIPLAIS